MNDLDAITVVSRASTIVATVVSRLATLRPPRPRGQARALPPRTRTALHRAAALGPFCLRRPHSLIASYERLGYG